MTQIKVMQVGEKLFPGRPDPNRPAVADGLLAVVVERFGATHTVEMHAGDVLAIDTPGGGGFGARQKGMARYNWRAPISPCLS